MLKAMTILGFIWGIGSGVRLACPADSRLTQNLVLGCIA
jgi:hypothetical protein